MSKPSIVSLLAMSAAVLATLPGQAADRSFMGTWTIAASQAAPWADAGERPVASDLRALMGKSVTFSADRIVAPRPLACAKPHYLMKSYPPDMLFQGTLKDPPRDAGALGFAGERIPTLETGCEGALDFHFVGRDKAMFGLNNRVYVLTRPTR